MTKRRGMSAVVVEVMLIVVALILTIVLGGFVFGTLNLYYAPAEVSAQFAACSTLSGSETCTITLANRGANPTTTAGCTLNVNGSKVQGTMTNGGVIPASGSLSNIGCTVNGANALSGTRVVGWISIIGGFAVYFTAVSS